MGTRERGIETTEFTDPATGRTVRQLTSNERLESKHAYYDIVPWSHDGRLISFSSVEPGDVRTPWATGLASRNGRLCVMDEETFEIGTVAEGGFYQAHNGVFNIWHPKQNTLFYHRSPEEVAALDIETGDERTMPGRMRQISPDGTTISYTRNAPETLARRGLYTMGAGGSDARLLVSAEQMYELTPNRGEFPIDSMRTGNTKWTPDSRHILFTTWPWRFDATKGTTRPDVHRSLYVVARDGSDARWLCYFAHHHSWTPDGSAVLFKDWADWPERKKPRMHLVDFDGSNRRVVIDEPVGSHPIMDPAMTRIVDFSGEGIFVVHIAEQRIVWMAKFRAPFDMSHSGTHPHPTWSRDGSQVIYNSAETGHSELYLVPMG
jgi:hypothetical protein